MADVVGTQRDHGTHTKFAAVLKSYTLITDTNNSYVNLQIQWTGRHINNDSTANTVSKTSFRCYCKCSVSNSTKSSSTYTYPASAISVPAGVGKTVDGPTVTTTIQINKTGDIQTITSISVLLTSTVSSLISTAMISGLNLSVPAADPYTLILYHHNNGESVQYSNYYQNVSKNLPTISSLEWSPPIDGYVFGGWATSAAAAAVGTYSYGDGAAVSFTKNTALYAVWKPPVIIYIKIHGRWKMCGGYVKVNDEWKQITSAYVKVDDNWKQIT